MNIVKDGLCALKGHNREWVLSPCFLFLFDYKKLVTLSLTSLFVFYVTFYITLSTRRIPEFIPRRHYHFPTLQQKQRVTRLS